MKKCVEIPRLLNLLCILLFFSTFSLSPKQQVFSNLPFPPKTLLYPAKSKALASQGEGQRREQKDVLHLFAKTYANGMHLGSWYRLATLQVRSLGPPENMLRAPSSKTLHIPNFVQMNIFKPTICIKALLA